MTLNFSTNLSGTWLSDASEILILEYVVSLIHSVTSEILTPVVM